MAWSLGGELCLGRLHPRLVIGGELLLGLLHPLLMQAILRLLCGWNGLGLRPLLLRRALRRAHDVVVLLLPPRKLRLLLLLQPLAQRRRAVEQPELFRSELARWAAVLEVALALALRELRGTRAAAEVAPRRLRLRALLLLDVELRKFLLDLVDVVHPVVELDRVRLLALLLARREAVGVEVELVALAHHHRLHLVDVEAVRRLHHLRLLVLVDPALPVDLALHELRAQQRVPVRAGLRLLQQHAHARPADEPPAPRHVDAARERELEAVLARAAHPVPDAAELEDVVGDVDRRLGAVGHLDRHVQPVAPLAPHELGRGERGGGRHRWHHALRSSRLAGASFERARWCGCEELPPCIAHCALEFAMRNATYQISTFAGAPGDRRNLKQCAMRNAQCTKAFYHDLLLSYG